MSDDRTQGQERGERLRAYLTPKLKAAGMTQEQLANALDISKAAVSGWYRTGKISRESLSGIRTALGVPLDELHAVLGDEQASNEIREPAAIYNDRYVYVKRVDGPHLAAGAGEVVWDFEEVEHSHAFRREWMQQKHLNPSRCKLMSVKGNSMAPTLNDRDVVMINMADRTVVSGEIYALVTEEGLRVKRLQRRADGLVWMISDNQLPQYAPEPITSDQVAVIGKVVWRGGEM